MSKRERVAKLLHLTGVNRLILRARAKTRAPLLSVLTYHSIDELADDYPFDRGVVDATSAQFEAQLEIVARNFSVIGIDALLHAVEGHGTLPPNPLLLTFDDGYKSNLYTAAPILRRFGMTAVFFIATDYVANRRLYWWDRINYLLRRSPLARVELSYPAPRTLVLDSPQAVAAAVDELLWVVKHDHGLDLERLLGELADATDVSWSDELEREYAEQLIMSWDEVRELRKLGMDVQSHTRRHRVLQTLATHELADELAGSREDLERELGEPVRTVSYPVGRTIAGQPQIRAAVKAAGYALGFSNASGVNYNWRRLDPYDIRRFAVDRDATQAMFTGSLALPPLAYVSPGHI